MVLLILMTVTVHHEMAMATYFVITGTYMKCQRGKHDDLYPATTHTVVCLYNAKLRGERIETAHPKSTLSLQNALLINQPISQFVPSNAMLDAGL